jgi:putative phosphotransacetylase
VDDLFGEGYILTKKQELMGGQYAAHETVTIVGYKLRAIENVRVLGPARRQTQAEISATDAVKLGVTVSLRDSGDLAGSAPIAIVGPKGAVYLREGCIIAARHIHMPPGLADKTGVADGDMVSVTVSNERGMTLDKVRIRVDASFTLEMHIDTDEANACMLKTGDVVKLHKKV